MSQHADAGHIPLVFATFRGWRPAWLVPDLVAAVTLAAILVPGQIAIAHLAGMPPTSGLWGTVAACVFVAVFASNRFLVMGCDSTIAPLLAAGITVAVAGRDLPYAGLVITTTLLAGVLLLVVGVFRLGWIADFLSRPIITGFMAGVAITIVVDQLPGLLGLPSGAGHVLERLGEVLTQLGSISWPTVAMGLGSLAVLLGAERINRRIPGALVVVIGAILLVKAFDLTAHGVAVLGPLPEGLPALQLPELSLQSLRIVLPTVLSVVLIALAQTGATTRSSAEAHRLKVDVNADFRGLGAGNVASSLVGGFAVNGSPSGTVIAGAMGVRSQVVSLALAGIIACFAVFAGGLLADLPMATLSAVLVYISIKIFNVGQMRDMWAFDIWAFLLMLLTLVGVVVLGVELGVVIAVTAAIVNRTARSSRPELLLLHQTADGQWQPVSPQEQRPPDVPPVYRLNGPLWFGNANWFKQEMLSVLDEETPPVGLVLDATGMDDIDYTGASILWEIDAACSQRGLPLLVVHVPGFATDALDRSGLAERIGPDRMFDSVPAAMAQLGAGTAPAEGPAPS